MKSCGKSTVGRCLASVLNYQFYDTDQLIENTYRQQHGESLHFSEIFKLKGERYFRQLEAEVIKSLISIKEPIVVATGGSTVMFQSNADCLMQLGVIIYLRASQATLLQRWVRSAPAFINDQAIKEELAAYYIKRAQRYQSVSNVVIDIDGKHVDAIVDETVQFLM